MFVSYIRSDFGYVKDLELIDETWRRTSIVVRGFVFTSGRELRRKEILVNIVKCHQLV
jgi:hypothetical protein